SVTLRIAAASLVCRDTWVSQKDLAKITKAALDDMLASKQHPMILFQSRTITQTAGQYTVDGDLTIRDVAKPARIVVSREGNRFRGESVIRLKDYNLKPPSAALGAVGTRNEMQFSFDLSASPK
ncbi:MAG: YceI family protein, partial [Bryobacteraceae bacterium]|nr:YceI family protein [Bryobacteraceae bacterium]